MSEAAKRFTSTTGSPVAGDTNIMTAGRSRLAPLWDMADRRIAKHPQRDGTAKRYASPAGCVF